MKIKTSIIFIHGIYHGSWCWENFTKYFEGLGYHTVAVNLFGDLHHSTKIGLHDHFNTIEYAIEKAKEAYHGPVILVGHSKGGGIVQCFIAQRPGKADGVVFLAALPLRRIGLFMPSFLWRFISNPRTACEMIQLLRVSYSLARSKPVSANILRSSALFSSRISIAESELYASLLSLEQLRPALELALFAFKSLRVDIPVNVVASTGDQVFSPWEEKLLADAYSGDVIVLNDLCHDMMLDPDWELAAESTAALVRRIENSLNK